MRKNWCHFNSWISLWKIFNLMMYYAFHSAPSRFWQNCSFTSIPTRTSSRTLSITSTAISSCKRKSTKWKANGYLSLSLNYSLIAWNFRSHSLHDKAPIRPADSPYNARNCTACSTRPSNTWLRTLRPPHRPSLISSFVLAPGIVLTDLFLQFIFMICLSEVVTIMCGPNHVHSVHFP